MHSPLKRGSSSLSPISFSRAYSKSPNNLNDRFIYYKQSKRELITQLQRQRAQIKKLTGDREEGAEILDRMRHGYLKELANLREQILGKEKTGKKFEYIEVHYFEPTEAMNAETCFILNTKLEEMKELYEKSLLRLQMQNHQLQK